MTWFLPLILFSIPVYTVSFLASRRGNLLVTLAALAVALLLWLADAQSLLPGLTRTAMSTTWTASLIGLCLGNVIVLLARRWKGEQGPR